MNYEITKIDLQKKGFQGFVTISSLIKNNSILPKSKGVYMILYTSQSSPKFKSNGSGGFFKGRNPNVSIQELEDNWVSNTAIIYIGKAGATLGLATLQSRLKQYLNFGQGKAVGHWGGRFIWQISNVEDLVVCWKALPNEEPAQIESLLIQEFTTHYGRRPFANLRN